MRAMSQALNFGKSVADNSWGMFCAFLKYKLEEQGKYLYVNVGLGSVGFPARVGMPPEITVIKIGMNKGRE